MNIKDALRVKQQAEFEAPNDTFIVNTSGPDDYEVEKITKNDTDRAILSIGRNEATIIRNTLLDLASMLDAIINKPNGG